MLREGTRYYASSFPALAGLSVTSYFDRRTDTVLVQLRFRGGHDEEAALDRWARGAGFTRFGDRWSHAKRLRFERSIWPFRTSQGPTDGAVVEFCAALERAALQRRTTAPIQPRITRLARGTHTQLSTEPSDISIDLAETPTLEMPTPAPDLDDGIPITWEPTSV